MLLVPKTRLHVQIPSFQSIKKHVYSLMQKNKISPSNINSWESSLFCNILMGTGVRGVTSLIDMHPDTGISS